MSKYISESRVRENIKDLNHHKSIELNAVSLGVDNTGAKNMSDEINYIIQNNNYSTITFPDGVYNIDKEIIIDNYVSLKLGVNAIFKCISTIDKIININRTQEKNKQFIEGGIIDGNGYANYGIYATYGANFQIYNMVVKNCLLKNIWLHSGYEFYLENIQIDNDLIYNINQNIIGLHAGCTDSVFSKIVIKNNTVGFINDSMSNEFLNIHTWGNKTDRLPYSIGMIANDETYASFFYSDTCAIGIQVNNSSSVFLEQSKFGFSTTYLEQLPTLTPIFIQNTTGIVYLYNGRLSSYGANIIIGTQMGRVKLYNCTVSDPFNTTSTYVNIQNYNNVFHRITLTNFTVLANNYKRITIPIVGLYYNDFYYVNMINDSNQNVDWKTYLTNGNLNIIYYNRTTIDVSVIGFIVNLTVVSNTNLPVNNLNFTVI